MKITAKEKKKIFNQVKPHKEHLKVMKDWDIYSSFHGLPFSDTLKLLFGGSWKQVLMTFGVQLTPDNEEIKQELIQIARDHQSEFTTIVHWNEYAEKHNLPSGHKFIAEFQKSWNQIKKLIGLPLVRGKEVYSREELIQIASDHQEHFTSRTTWDEYATKHDLPNSHKFYAKFRNWRIVQETIGLPFRKGINEYSKVELLSIAKKHIDNFTTVSRWNDYARHRQLPLAKHYMNVFDSWSKAKFELGKVYNLQSKLQVGKSYSDDYLLKTANTYSQYIGTMKEWNAFARPNKLPLAMVFAKRFGSWQAFKDKINHKN